MKGLVSGGIGILFVLAIPFILNSFGVIFKLGFLGELTGFGFTPPGFTPQRKAADYESASYTRAFTVKASAGETITVDYD